MCLSVLYHMLNCYDCVSCVSSLFSLGDNTCSHECKHKKIRGGAWGPGTISTILVPFPTVVESVKSTSETIHKRFLTAGQPFGNFNKQELKNIKALKPRKTHNPVHHVKGNLENNSVYSSEYSNLKKGNS